MRCVLWILGIFMVLIKTSLTQDCSCQKSPSCRCDNQLCYCDHTIIPPCHCGTTAIDHQEIATCHARCEKFCLYSCSQQQGKDYNYCRPLCQSTCSHTCTQTVNIRLLSTALASSCGDECSLNCYKGCVGKYKYGEKCKPQCTRSCRAACDKTITKAFVDYGDVIKLPNTDIVKVESEYECKGNCIGKCIRMCQRSGADDDVCLPTCQSFCEQKCTFEDDYKLNWRVPDEVCISACKPHCNHTCVIDKTLELAFHFLEKTRDIARELPSMEEIKNVTMFPMINATKMDRSSREFVESPVERCKLSCYGDCFNQCATLKRQDINCHSVCNRTCDVNCNSTKRKRPTLAKELSINAQKCQKQLMHRCRRSCRSYDCLSVCESTYSKLCQKFADCSANCHSSCRDHCLLRDKGYAQCSPACADACIKECHIPDSIRYECQETCLDVCKERCVANPNSVACKTNCPVTCINFCFA